jgi:FkbM family methyltransferase
MTFTSELNRFLRRSIGLEIHKTHSSFDEARMHVINSEKIALLIDGGANEGQWATRIRRDGYSGRILSLEPGTKAFSKLEFNSKDDPWWDVDSRALGSCEAILPLHLSSNDGMSSSLKRPERHLTEFPSVSFSGLEDVSVTTLESLLQDVTENVMVKLDIQGFELEALKGIGVAIDKIVAIELEMTLVPMYRGEASVGRVLVTLETMGFKLFSINEFGKGKNGSVSYFDVLAIREH